MINLVFNHTEVQEFIDKEMDVEHICNVMWDAGYAISEWDAFCAWLSETEVWEDPFDYSEDEIVNIVLFYTNVVWEPKDPWLDEVTEEVSEDATPFEEGLDEILRQQFPYINAWAEAQSNEYEPKKNARPEGFIYDADTNSFNAPSEAWKY